MDMSVYFDKRHLVKHSYATVEDFKVRSEAWETLATQPITQWYAEQLRPYAFLNVLDAGCGLGRFSGALAAMRPILLTAIDISDAMLEATRERMAAYPGRHEFLRQSIEETTLPARSFDLVMANLVLFHVPDIKASFAKLADLLKPGGYLALLTADFDWMAELNRLQDRALLKLGFDYDDAVFTAPGTNRFCDANLLIHAPESVRLVKKPWFDGTMHFPDAAAMLNFYQHTMRYKNAAMRIGDQGHLAKTVLGLIEEQHERTGRFAVSSSLFLYVFQKAQ